MKKLVLGIFFILGVFFLERVDVFAQECVGGGTYDRVWDSSGNLEDVTIISTSTVPVGSWSCFIEPSDYSRCNGYKCYYAMAKKCIQKADGEVGFSDDEYDDSSSTYEYCGLADMNYCSLENNEKHCRQYNYDDKCKLTVEDGTILYLGWLASACQTDTVYGLCQLDGSIDYSSCPTGQSCKTNGNHHECKKNTCTYEGKTYDNNVQFCDSDIVRECKDGKISVIDTCSNNEVCLNFKETKTARCESDDPNNFCTQFDGTPVSEIFDFDSLLKGNNRCIDNKLYLCEEENIPNLREEDCSIRTDENIYCGSNGSTTECIDKNTLEGNDQSRTMYTDSVTSIYNPLCDDGKSISTAFGCIPYEASGFAPKLLQIIFGIAGGIAFLLMVYGFILMATSSGDEKKLQAAKETITSAVTGLLVSIFALLLFRLIAVNILKIPGL